MELDIVPELISPIDLEEQLSRLILANEPKQFEEPLLIKRSEMSNDHITQTALYNTGHKLNLIVTTRSTHPDIYSAIPLDEETEDIKAIRENSYYRAEYIKENGETYLIVATKDARNSTRYIFKPDGVFLLDRNQNLVQLNAQTTTVVLNALRYLILNFKEVNPS